MLWGITFTRSAARERNNSPCLHPLFYTTDKRIDVIAPASRGYSVWDVVVNKSFDSVSQVAVVIDAKQFPFVTCHNPNTTQ